MELNFNSEPISALKKIARLDKSEWKKQITKEINTIKKEISLAVEMMEESIMSKVENILDKKRFITEINELTEKYFTKQTTVNKSNTKLNYIKP